MSFAGDAQSDVMSGATIALMVLFVAILLYLLLLLAVFAESNAELQETLDALQSEEVARQEQEAVAVRATKQARAAADERDHHALKLHQLQEAREAAEAEAQQAQAEAKQLRRQLSAERSKAAAEQGGGSEDGNLVATGLKLWVAGDEAFITDAEPRGRSWQKRWQCSKQVETVRSSWGGRFRDAGSLGR